MHFSNKALSLLAQSLPLAVAYRAGWRKREKSKWQSAILQAALYEEFRDRKGLVLEKKRAGGTHPVQDKQGTVFEKKHSGTVHPVQGTASSDIPSVDRGASVECDPLSKAPDAGIFACGVDRHCVESEESELGGFCVALERAPILSRVLQADFTDSCTDGADGLNKTCDCSQFNNTSGVGSFTCTTEGFCFEEYATVCGKYEVTYTVENAYTYTFEYCFEPDGGMPAESLCYSKSYEPDAFECEFKVNDAICSNCSDSCPASSTESGSTFDCTNTVLDVQGNTCETGRVGSFFGVGIVPTTAPLDTPSTSPVEEMPTTSTAPFETPSASPMPLAPFSPFATPAKEMPTTSTAPFDTPSAPPVEMSSPATSSGSRQTAKVTIVVSVAGAACLASFGV